MSASTVVTEVCDVFSHTLNQRLSASKTSKFRLAVV